MLNLRAQAGVLPGECQALLELSVARLDASAKLEFTFSLLFVLVGTFRPQVRKSMKK